jgi:SOS-response transcriptional repressor LexA
MKTPQRVGGHVWLMPANTAFQPIPAGDATIVRRHPLLGSVAIPKRTGL